MSYKRYKERMKTKNKRNYSKQNGITLIALVVTIVVLLILAGVSVNALFGNSGIIEKAKEAQNAMNKARENDLEGINELTNWIDEQLPTKTVRVILDKNNLEVTIESGTTETVTLTAKTENITGNLEWTSSNTDVATVSGNDNTGIVTLKAKGTTIITVKCGEYKDTCTITVSEEKMVSFSAVNHSLGQLVECKAKEGMTWGEFVSDSKYNTIGLTVWNDIIIYNRESLVKTAASDYTILYANLFFSDETNTSRKFYFTWDKIDNSIEGRLILGYPTTKRTDYTEGLKNTLKNLVEAEGGTITDWTVE